jgi:hypothetical protein
MARAHGISWHKPEQDGVRRRLRDRDGWGAGWDRQMGTPMTPPPRGLPPVQGIECRTLPTWRRRTPLGLIHVEPPLDFGDKGAGRKRLAEQRCVLQRAWLLFH